MADVMCLWDFVYAQQKVSYVHSKTQRTPERRHMKPLSSFSVSSGSSGNPCSSVPSQRFCGNIACPCSPQTPGLPGLPEDELLMCEWDKGSTFPFLLQSSGLLHRKSRGQTASD